jgi:hypothetical protein
MEIILLIFFSLDSYIQVVVYELYTTHSHHYTRTPLEATTYTPKRPSGDRRSIKPRRRQAHRSLIVAPRENPGPAKRTGKIPVGTVPRCEQPRHCERYHSTEPAARSLILLIFPSPLALRFLFRVLHGQPIFISFSPLPATSLRVLTRASPSFLLLCNEIFYGP